jgi:hypothetical protein
MFTDLKYFWSRFRKYPSMRNFKIVMKILQLEIKCIAITGYTIDEIKEHDTGTK